MTIHSAGITDADLDRFEKVAEPIYRSTATAGEVSRFQVSDLGMWVVRLVTEVRRLRKAGAESIHLLTSTEEDREVLARLVHNETGEAEEESGFVADAILAVFDVRLKAHTPTDEGEFALGECDGSGTCSAARHIHGCYTVHRADQCDAPDEYGHLLSEPQGEPSDAQVQAAFDIIQKHRGGTGLMAVVRDALRAAGGVR